MYFFISHSSSHSFSLSKRIPKHFKMCFNQILRNEDGNIEGKKIQGKGGKNVKTGYTTKILNRNRE